MSDCENSYAMLSYPYTRLMQFQATGDALRKHGRDPGSAVVWQVRRKVALAESGGLRNRPGGLALLVILPKESELLSHAEFGLAIQSLRPHGILPYHGTPDPWDLAQVLRRPPLDLGGEVMDYVRWRGLKLDRDTLRLLRRILDLAGELRSISAVARSLYVSRRALGRRLSVRGLPVPSHWLQMGRLLRAAIRLQNSDATVASVAYEHGYPDGFSLSNQMERLVGHRPSEVRRRLGWEWLVEAWLRQEAEMGRLMMPHELRTRGLTASRQGATRGYVRRAKGGRAGS